MVENICVVKMVHGVDILIATYETEEDASRILCSLSNWDSLKEVQTLPLLKTNTTISGVSKEIVDEARKLSPGSVVFRINIIGKTAIAYFKFAELVGEYGSKELNMAYLVTAGAIAESFVNVSWSEPTKDAILNLLKHAHRVRPY